MKATERITRCEIITQVSERIITKKEKTGLVTYDYENENEIKDTKNIDIADYTENNAKDRFNKSLKFLQIDNKTSKSKTREQKTYRPIFTDITYIIALHYDIENDSNLICTLNRIIKKNYKKLDANQLASFFMPFYDRENWEYLDEEFLKKHEETYSRFLELQKHDPQSCLSDIKQFCIAFYNHEELPPIENIMN